MLPTQQFNELIPRGASKGAPAIWPLPSCGFEPFDREELDKFPAFRLMRLVRDWVEGWDEAGAGLWFADRPARLYEASDIQLCAAHAVTAHLCATPEHARLPDATLLGLACRRYWGPASWPPLVSLESKLSDERPRGWSRIAPWWRAAAMLRDHDVNLAAFALHHLWMSRNNLELARLTDETADGIWSIQMVRVKAAPPPLHLRAILTGVLGPDDAEWPTFERALLREFDLGSTLDEAYFEASYGFEWDDVTGMSTGDPLLD